MALLDEKTLAFLQERRFGVLATIGSSNIPQQTVMWYDIADGLVLMNTAAGRVKEKNMRKNPVISLCVEEGYRFVTLVGKAELIDNQAVAQEDIKRLAIRYNGPEAAQSQVEAFMKEQRVSIHMHIDRVFANLD